MEEYRWTYCAELWTQQRAGVAAGGGHIHSLSSSLRLHTAVPYSSLLTFRGPVGILLRFSRDGWNPPIAHAAPPPLKPLLLLSPKGPDLAPVALRPFRGVRPQGLERRRDSEFSP